MLYIWCPVKTRQTTHMSTQQLDTASLEAYLTRHIKGFEGELHAEKFAGGQSNPTFKLTAAGKSYVLRRKPPGELLKSAHAVDREYRVISALQDTDVPVPRTYLLCEDESVIGSMFYVMEYMEGRILWDPLVPEAKDNAERAAIYDSMNKTMAALHCVDVDAVGLGDYGRPGNYFARQTDRWTKQYRASETQRIEAMEQLIPWLVANMPEDDGVVSLVHGDYRLDNMMFHPTEPRLLALLDWELSTLGHPLVDVAFNTQAWNMAPDENGGLLGLDLPALGIPAEPDYLAQYYRLADAPEEMTDFHRVFAMFRGAVGSASVAARGAQGLGTLPDSVRVGRFLAHAYATRGMQIAERAHA